MCSVCVDTTPLIEYSVSQGGTFFEFELPNATTIDGVDMFTVGQAFDLKTAQRRRLRTTLEMLSDAPHTTSRSWQ